MDLVQRVVGLGKEIWKIVEDYRHSFLRLHGMWVDLKKDLDQLKAAFEQEKKMGFVERMKHRKRIQKVLDDDKAIKAVISQAKDTQAKLSIIRKKADQGYQQTVKLLTENTSLERQIAKGPGTHAEVFSAANKDISERLDDVMTLQGLCAQRQKTLDALLKEIQSLYLDIQKMRKDYQKAETTEKDLEKWHKSAGKKYDKVKRELDKADKMTDVAKDISRTGDLARLAKPF